jgi:hypothetical protein
MIPTLVIDATDSTPTLNPFGNLIRGDRVALLVPFVQHCGHHDGCTIGVATDAKAEQIAADGVEPAMRGRASPRPIDPVFVVELLPAMFLPQIKPSDPRDASAGLVAAMSAVLVPLPKEAGEIDPLGIG